MHQVLYRKWRPKKFEDVCGQDHITSVLRYEIEHGKTAHAYLFCGSRGTGKTTCSKILAKAVNCRNPVNGEPCGECDICTGIDNGSIVDVIEMDAASNNGVDDIRQIRDEVSYSPSSAKYRVYIVDEVHMLTMPAFNALLKTLEEPPENVIFILATTEIQKLPATIISRCRRFDFRRIALRTIADRLMFIAKEENIPLEDDAALLLARLAEGGMRDAISMLELCSSEGVSVDTKRVREVAGVAGRELCAAVARATAAGDSARIFRITGELYASSKDITAFWQELVSFYRDMTVIKSVNNENTAKQYLDLTKEEYNETAKSAAGFTYDMLAYHCEVLDEAYISMQRNVVNKRLVAEFALLRMAKKIDTTPQALAARISALESGAVRVVANTPAEEAAGENGAVQAVEGNGADSAGKDPGAEIKNTDAVSAPLPSAEAAAADEKVFRALPYWKEILRDYHNVDNADAAWFEKSQAFRAQGSDHVVVKLVNPLAKNASEKAGVKDYFIARLNKYDKTVSVEFRMESAESKNGESFINDIDIDEDTTIIDG